jgi:riboflavin kinase/FMN adenylyltransferase
VLSAGNFDGVHLGHQRLIETTVERARALGGSSVLLGFEPHPYAFFRGRSESEHLLCSREQQCELLQTMGVDYLWLLPFNDQVARLSAERFVDELLVAGLGVTHVIVGDNFRFGAGRAGGAELLRKRGAEKGFSTETLLPIMFEGERISSSRIRHCLLEGKVEALTPMLGRPYALRGVVQGGDRRGRVLGFPTANLSLPQQLLPADGIYVTRLRRLGRDSRSGNGAALRSKPEHCASRAVQHEEPWPAVSSVGTRPTFYADGQRIVETHLLKTPNGGIDLYEQAIEIDFLQWLRPQERFEDAQQLQVAMRSDTERARVFHARP